jgi:hypothetical protein
MQNALIISLILLTTSFYFPKSDSLIKETRNQIGQINLTLYDKNYPNSQQLSELKSSIEKLAKNGFKQLPKSIQSKKNLQADLDGLYSTLEVFKLLVESKPEIDSLKKVFRVVNINFNSIFGNYLYEELLKSKKIEILIFSTSISCECTLEMCYKQETEIQLLQKEYPNKFDYAVVDSFSNFELQSKYNIGFIPTVLIINEKNKEVKRFVREENLYKKLSYMK